MDELPSGGETSLLSAHWPVDKSDGFLMFSWMESQTVLWEELKIQKTWQHHCPFQEKATIYQQVAKDKEGNLVTLSFLYQTLDTQQNLNVFRLNKLVCSLLHYTKRNSPVTKGAGRSHLFVIIIVKTEDHIAQSCNEN